LDEAYQAIHRLKNNKVPGIDGNIQSTIALICVIRFLKKQIILFTGQLA